MPRPNSARQEHENEGRQSPLVMQRRYRDILCQGQKIGGRPTRKSWHQMADQQEDNTGRRRNLSIKHVLRGGIDGLGRKPRADKTWVHLQTYFKYIWTATMLYQGDNPHKHNFESAANAEEDRGEQTGRLANNLREVAVAATANKEHIQQMTTQNDDLLKVVRKQQAQIDKHQTHID